MAFYNERMVKNSNLMKAWRAAHSLQVEEASVLEICEEIESHLRRHRHPCSRLSLRTASSLLAGASRLHLHEVDQLMHDAFKLAYWPIAALPDNLLILPVDNVYSCSSSLGTDGSSSSRASMSDEPSDDYDDTGESSEATDDESYDSSVPSIPQRKNQAVQTEPIVDKKNQEELDPNLPFGQFFIYDNPHRRYPSMLMFTSLNEKVKNIISKYNNK